MKVTFKYLPEFERLAKDLRKKYKSFKDDYSMFLDELERNPFGGEPLGHHTYKNRMAIAAKGAYCNETQICYLDERSFAYELYRQWQDLMENSREDLVINAEVPKECVDKKTFLSRLEKIFGLTKEGKPHRRFYPDLVCHHSQFNHENQEVICEIKTKSGINDNAKLTYDLNKLAAYMTDRVLLYHPFKVGVFILVGGDFSDIQYSSNKTIDNKKDEIYCILYNIEAIGDNEESTFISNVQCRSLREIENNNKQKR